MSNPSSKKHHTTFGSRQGSLQATTPAVVLEQKEEEDQQNSQLKQQTDPNSNQLQSPQKKPLLHVSQASTMKNLMSEFNKSFRQLKQDGNARKQAEKLRRKMRKLEKKKQELIKKYKKEGKNITELELQTFDEQAEDIRSGQASESDHNGGQEAGQKESQDDLTVSSLSLDIVQKWASKWSRHQ